MKVNTKDVFLNFRIEKSLQEKLDKRAKKIGLSRAELARQYFKMGAKLPVDVPLTFSLLLYERTDEMHGIKEIKQEAIEIIKELFA